MESLTPTYNYMTKAAATVINVIVDILPTGFSVHHLLIYNM